jgi:hypothetical protein
MRPFYLETTNMLKFAYANLNYPQRSDNRTDASYTFTAGLTKKISDTYTSGLMATYMMNNSTVDSFTYKKWTAMLTLTAINAF